MEQADSKSREAMMARSLVAVKIKKGELLRQPCQICGREKTDAHHNDYSKPLEVQWLCRKHHRDFHSGNELKQYKDPVKRKSKNEISKWLPFGGQTDIAKKFGVSQSYVSQVMSGTAKNDKILDALIELARLNKAAQYKIQKEFENKVNSI